MQAIKAPRTGAAKSVGTRGGKQEQEQRVTLETSTRNVKLLLNASIASIAYLRGLFSEDNFETQRISVPRGTSQAKPSKEPPTASQKRDADKGLVSTKYKHISRGCSDDADRLLDLLELGVEDAIDKMYLKQLLMAIYLDPDHPTDIVECYTFSFSYSADGQGQARPELTVQNAQGTVLSSTSNDTSGGGARSETDIKRQIQKMIKALIIQMEALDDLPKVRFLTFKLLYHEHTPENYQPPLFSAAEAEAARFHMGTALIEEHPDTCGFGKLETGFHTVSLKMATIAHHMPEPTEQELPLAKWYEKNIFDARERIVIWDAEKIIDDAPPLGGAKPSSEGSNAEDAPQPIGVKENDELVPVDKASEKTAKQIGAIPDPENATQVHYAQPAVPAAKRFPESWSDNRIYKEIAAQVTKEGRSQDDDATQLDPIISRVKSVTITGISPMDEELEETQREPETEDEDDAGAPLEMPPAAQPPPTQRDVSMVDAASVPTSEAVAPTEVATQQPISRTSTTRTTRLSTRAGRWAKRAKRIDLSRCECGDNTMRKQHEDVIQCDSCEGWKHAHCYGYESDLDERIPARFYCYLCSVICTQDEMALGKREREIETGLADAQSLALFRRAIIVCWQNGSPMGQKPLAAKLHVDTRTAAQQINRLRVERYIVEENGSAALTKKGTARKRLKSMVNKSKEQVEYNRQNYFTPGQGKETGLLQLLAGEEVDAEGSDFEPTQQDTQKRTPEDPIDDADSLSPPPLPPKTPFKPTIRGNKGKAAVRSPPSAELQLALQLAKSAPFAGHSNAGASAMDVDSVIGGSRRSAPRTSSLEEGHKRKAQPEPARQPKKLKLSIPTNGGIKG